MLKRNPGDSKRLSVKTRSLLGYKTQRCTDFVALVRGSGTDALHVHNEICERQYGMLSAREPHQHASASNIHYAKQRPHSVGPIAEAAALDIVHVNLVATSAAVIFSKVESNTTFLIATICIRLVDLGTFG